MQVQLSKEKFLVYPRPKDYENYYWYKYSIGYKEAVLLIINELAHDDTKISKEIIFPILFLFRHFTELLLKEIIAEYASFIGAKIEIPKTHNLETLWKRVKPISKDLLLVRLNDKNSRHRSLWTEDSIYKIEEYILEVNKYDKKSASFRFPIDEFGNFSLKEGFQIPLPALKDRINKVFSALQHILFSMTLLKIDK
jgi:hypothetical protein